MTSSTMCTPATLTAVALVNVNSAAGGTAGMMIPEHPGRSITVFSGFSGIAQNTEHAQYSPLYDEFRVKAILVEYVPFTSTPTSTFTVEFACCCDYDSEITAGSLTTSQMVVRYASGRLLNPSAEHQLVFKPPSRRAFTDWQSCANTAARGSIYYFLKSNVSGTLQVGNLVVKYIVTYRQTNG
jgi:hypothetical protein